MTNTMAIDQYGNHYHALGEHPRKELLSRLCRKGATKMYRDTSDGHSRHVGYIIGGLWLEIFTVSEWNA